jgi:hypothetical protein
VPGINTDNDLAVQVRPRIIQYLQQDSNSPSNLEQARKQLFELVGYIEQVEKTIRAQPSSASQQTPGARTAARAASVAR